MPVLLASVSALSVSTPMNLSNDSYNATYPNIQNVGNNVYAVWTEEAHGIWFRVSTDGGQVWSSAIRLSPTGNGAPDFPLMTAIGTDVYVVWSQKASIYIAASTTSGASFSTAIIVSGTIASSQTPVVAAYGNDVYVAFDGGGHSYVTASSNNGVTWTSPFEYSTGPEPQIAAWGTNAYAVADASSRASNVVAVTNNNGLTWTKSGTTSGSEPWVSAYGSNVIVAWETKGSASVVRAITSTNSGKSFSSPTELSSAVPNSWAPMTGISGNTEYVAWRSNPGSSNSQEYVAVSLNAGSSWSPPTAIGIAGHDNSWPVTVPGSGSTAFIAWYVRTGTTSTSPWEAVVVETTNSGTSWSSPAVLGPSLAESDIATAAISSNGGTLFVIWTETSSSLHTQVYFATGS